MRQRTDAARMHGPAAAQMRAAGPPLGQCSRHKDRAMTRIRQGSGTGPAIPEPDEAGCLDPSTQRDEARMVNVHMIDELAERLAALVPPGLKQAREDLTDNFRSALRA